MLFQFIYYYYCIMQPQSNIQQNKPTFYQLFNQNNFNTCLSPQANINGQSIPFKNLPPRPNSNHAHTDRFPNVRPFQYQSHIWGPHPTANNQNSLEKPDTHSRQAFFQQQNIQLQNAQYQNNKYSHSKERIVKYQNFSKDNKFNNQRLRKPRSNSTNNTHQDEIKTLLIQKGTKVESRLPFRPCPKFISQKNEQINELNLPLNNTQDYSKRQAKTDRDAPNCFMVPNMSIPNNLKYSTTINGTESQNVKPQRRELDSTVNSSVSKMNCTKKQQISQSSNKSVETKIVKKNVTPPNFWPLSISPSQQKRQNILYQQLVVQSKKLTNNDEINTEFKKKKNFQFLRGLKKSMTSSQQRREFELNDFELLDKIGKGAFGDVYVAQQKKTGFLCVLKKLLKKKLIQNKLEEQLLRQIKIQSFLNHRHLTSLYGFFKDQSYIYLILQLMPDGSMMQVKKKRKIPEPQVSSYLRQICLGLKYMHTQHVIHRDIKPQNIFLNQGYAKIGDFGCSIYTQTFRNTQIGSLAYISPEQLKKQTYNQKIDVWSLGVMTYQMLVGVSPFEKDLIMIARRQRGPQLSDLKFPEGIELSEQAIDFLIHMLDPEPTKRLGIQDALKHQFIQKHAREEQLINLKMDSC